MAKSISLKRELAIEVCAKHPESPSMTLARKIYKENPEVFKDLEDARYFIRNVRGKTGEKMRKEIKDKSLYDKAPRPLNPFSMMPKSHAETYEPLYITSSKTLVISDLHIPYHDEKAIKIALKFGMEKDVECILINGDLMDFHRQSRFQTDPRKRTTKEEFDATRQFLQMLRALFPKARIIYKLGNHDERWENWLFVKAPELFGDPEYLLETRLRLGELGIEIVKDKLPVKIGKLTIFHGHELQGSGGVNPARATFNKTISNVAIGHCHRSSQHTEPTFDGDVIVTTSAGCLCGLYPDFARVNKWNLGFMYVELNVKTKEYLLHNKKIINYKIY